KPRTSARLVPCARTPGLRYVPARHSLSNDEPLIAFEVSIMILQSQLLFLFSSSLGPGGASEVHWHGGRPRCLPQAGRSQRHPLVHGQADWLHPQHHDPAKVHPSGTHKISSRDNISLLFILISNNKSVNMSINIYINM